MIKILLKWLERNVSPERYLFTPQDLRSLFIEFSDSAFKTLLSRAVTNGYLEKICRGLYGFNSAAFSRGLLLFHAAAYIRSNELNYISLETALSDAGIISQIPINVITIMSSGRSNRISCGKFGVIEFIHTRQKPLQILDHLTFDSNCRLWRADVQLALKDMKRAHRNCDLINWEIANESF